jgi:hypothetical protein
VDHGIYIVTAPGSGGSPFILTRATDYDQNSEVTGGSAVFTTEGTSNADTGWVLITDDPITVDTTALQWTQFTGAANVIGGAGILKSGSTLSVELHTAADAQGAGTNGGTSGLEFDAAGDGGKLRVRVNAAGGIQRGASGLELEIDDTPNTLDVDADGLKVVGLPSLFLINDVAVSANVTAANLDTLTGGTASGADALHRHNRVDGNFIVDESISAGDPVAYSTSVNNRIVKGLSSNDAKTRIIAVARTAQATAGNTLEACIWGVCPGVLSGATVGTPYYLATAGGLSTSLPGSNNRIIRCGVAMNATDLFVSIIDYGKKI